MTDPLELLKQTLRDSGQSVTETRLSVFEALQGKEPQTMNEVVQNCNGLDRASVYRTITLFERLGIVQRLHIGWKYKLELSDQFTHHHHHATCNRCGQTLALPEDSQLENRLQQLAQQVGFLPQDHQIEISGLCERCRPATVA